MISARPHAAGCLEDDVAYDFLHGRLGEAALARAQNHLTACADCREVIAQTANYLSDGGAQSLESVPDAASTVDAPRFPSSAARPRPVLLRSGARVGRYLVESVTGSGGMSVVYAAHDPRLERKVALKVLRSELPDAAADPEGQRRLLREARAMARLSHPNVVGVYDTGLFDDQIFIAMEFIEGQTVRQWLREKPRPWSAVIEVFAAAGRGISHAHATGLVHRDFKPENVLISTDGRVRVTDFGLARPASSPAAGAGDGAGQSVPSPAWYATSRLTQTGVVAGTPAYMAPEQLLGRPPDPRTDQFSFCVALHEALYGVRPFSGRTFAVLAEQILIGAVVDLPRQADVPDWLRPVLLRGLSAAPEARFESMDALLAALLREPRRRRRAFAIVAAAAAMAVAVGVAVLGSATLRNAPLASSAKTPDHPAATAPTPSPVAVPSALTSATSETTIPSGPPRAAARPARRRARPARGASAAVAATPSSSPPPSIAHQTSDDDALLP